jgi:cell division protein FtsZ
VAEAAPAPEPEAEVQAEAPAPVASYSDDDDDWGTAPTATDATADEPLELEMEAEEPAPAPAAAAEPADDLLSNASRLVDEDQPVGGGLPGRRRGLVSSDSGEGGASAGSADEGADAPIQPATKAPRVSTGGATLFERMANLSRGGRSKDEEEDEDDGDGPSISIPRFLGRQNNQ